MLHVRRFGSGPPLLALHGFTLTGQQFAPHAAGLGRTIVAPDLPGHGLSANAPADVVAVTTSISSVVDALASPLPLLGYSQGGRIALLTALADSSNISCLVLISAGAGIEDNIEREKRIVSDAEMANEINEMGLEVFLDAWTTTGVTSNSHLTQDHIAMDRTVRLENTADALGRALTGYGQGVQPSVWEQLDRLELPVLLITGEEDTKYTAISRRMMDKLPDAEMVILASCGHDPLADDPAATHAVVSGFLDRHC